MQIVRIQLLHEFAKEHADVRAALAAWVDEIERAAWTTPNDVKVRFPNASFLSDNRIVFNIKGNNYRLLVQVYYERGIVRVLQVGTHAEYDKWKL